jgi:hypothetical protein
MKIASRLTRAAVATAALALGAASAGADPAGFAFLEVPAGAPASAMGGAYASVAEGIEAAFWNPAGLAAIHGVQLTASHYEFLEHLRHTQFGVAGNRFGGGMAATLRAMYSEPITERDALGNETGTFGAHDLEFALAYGRALGERLRLGGSAQVVRERISDFSATTWALGGGATWNPAAIPAARMSLSVHNLGPAGRYRLDGVDGAPVPLPAAVQAGGSYGLEAGGLSLRGALEARWTRGRTGIAMLGGELSHPSGATLRAGFRVNDEATNFSVGAGYASAALHLDYAYVPFRLELGDTHRVSISAQF